MPEILEASPRPGPHASRFPHIPAGLGRRVLWHAIPPLCSAQISAVRPKLAPPDQARSRPAPRRPAHPQAASKVGNSLRSGHFRAFVRSQALNATCVSRKRHQVHGDAAAFCAERKIPINIAGIPDKLTVSFPRANAQEARRASTRQDRTH